MITSAKSLKRPKKYHDDRTVTRILWRGGGGGGGGGRGDANEAKVDQTTEMYFLLSDPFI